MAGPEKLIEVHRGPFEESTHWGHAVICDANGTVLEAWGDADALIYPRSSCKMVQALPLMESGIADGLREAQKAFLCASHQGGAIHREMAAAWLSDLGLSEADLRCGVQKPQDEAEAHRLIRTQEGACQLHNNCSGKHCGFLMLSQHMNAGPEYVEVDHPLQRKIRQTFEEVTELDSPGYGIDGCSAPNFATTVTGLGRAMGKFSAAREDGDGRERAMYTLTRAMARHPEYVAGEGRACTTLMRAMDHKVAVKTGAEGVFVAIIPEMQRGIALKITDGATRAAEAVITSLLVRCGALSGDHPVARQYMHGPIRNWRGTQTGFYRPASALLV
jgi:L-asparaginase II